MRDEPIDTSDISSPKVDLPIDRSSTEGRLRAEVARLETELADARALHEFSRMLIGESNVSSVYDQLLDAAMSIMSSDFATIQRLHEDRGDGGELELLEVRGLTPEDAEPWRWVRQTNTTTCGLTLRKRERIIFSDVEVDAAASEDLIGYRAAGIRSAQSTPLITRSGHLIGIISTHWRKPHVPSPLELARLDVVAREAADQIERRAHEEDLDDNLSAMTLLQELGQICADTTARYDVCLQKIVEAAIGVGHAQMADLQLLDDDGSLRIAAQYGFDQPFLEFFKRINRDDASVCAAVLRVGGRVLVPDVEKSPIFAGQPSLDVMLAAGSRAVQTTALMSGSGKLLGMISTHYATPRRLNARTLRLLDLLARQAADFIERKQSEAKLQQQATLLQAINDNTSELIFVKDLEGRLTYANRATLKTVGLSEDQQGSVVDRELFSVMTEHDLIGEADRHVARTGETMRVEEPFTSPDGVHRVFLSTKSPLRNDRGEIVGVIGISHDVTEQKEAERTRKLLVDELNHRAKNMLATVQAIATQSFKYSVRPEEFIASFTGRIQAIARAHTVLTRSAWADAELRDIIADQLLMGQPDPRITFEGPPVMLAAQQVLQLSLAIHELGTNARKYGALSKDDGKLSIEWTLHSDANRELRLNWCEETTVEKSDSSRSGFGSILVRSIAADGKAEMIHTARGIVWNIRIALAEVQQQRRGSSAAKTLGVQAVSHSQTALIGKRVLIVEDEVLIAMEIAAILEGARIDTVGPVTSLPAALDIIETTTFDAALLDMNLSGERVDAVAAALIRQNVPIAFLTGYGSESLPPEFAGAQVLNKPFMPAQLLSTLVSILDRKAKTVVQLVAQN